MVQLEKQLGYMLDNWEIKGLKIFFLLQNDHTNSGADPAPYLASTEDSFQWGKVARAWS